MAAGGKRPSSHDHDYMLGCEDSRRRLGAVAGVVEMQQQVWQCRHNAFMIRVEA
jgi:hypothetical protein